MTFAIIPARGGSKRLPRKNVRSFCGRPLIAWSIVQAICSKGIDGVFVSTDDDEIEEISKSYGAMVIRRPKWLDADQAAANRPINHALQVINAEWGSKFDCLVTMLATTPLNLPNDIDKGIDIYRKTGADMLRPLIPKRETVLLRKTHPFVARTEIFDKNYTFLSEGPSWNICSPNWYLAMNMNQSDLDSVLNNPNNWAKCETYFIEAKYWQYADVDTAEEFEFAEVLMEHYILKGRGMDVYYDYQKENELEQSQENFHYGNEDQI